MKYRIDLTIEFQTDQPLAETSMSGNGEAFESFLESLPVPDTDDDSIRCSFRLRKDGPTTLESTKLEV